MLLHHDETPTHASARHQLDRETGAFGILSYPFDRYHRIDTGFGFEKRNFSLPVQDPTTGEIFLQSYRDSFPVASASFSGDNTVYKEFGPVSGRRYDLGMSYAH